MNFEIKACLFFSIDRRCFLKYHSLLLLLFLIDNKLIFFARYKEINMWQGKNKITYRNTICIDILLNVISTNYFHTLSIIIINRTEYLWWYIRILYVCLCVFFFLLRYAKNNRVNLIDSLVRIGCTESWKYTNLLVIIRNFL